MITRVHPWVKPHECVTGRLTACSTCHLCGAAEHAAGRCPYVPVVEVTAREWEVLAELVIDGQGNKVLGQRLFITEDTVKSHVKHLMKKTGTTTRTHLALVVAKRQVVIIQR